MKIKNYDFNELHNSKFVIDAIKENNIAKKKVAESSESIKNYVRDFVETFIFTINTIDSYISKNDIKLICKKDKRLKDFYKPGLKMSEIILNLRQSDFFQKLKGEKYKAINTNYNYEVRDLSYQYEHFFVDIINKQIFFFIKEIKNIKPLHRYDFHWLENFTLDSWNFILDENSNEIVIYIYVNYLYRYKAAVECVYPTIQTKESKEKLGEIRIDLLTNTILKNEIN